MQDKDQKRICALHLSALPSGKSAAKPRQFDAITPVYDDVCLETGNSRGRLEQTEQHFDSSTADSGSRGRLLLVVLPGLKTARAITADPSWQLQKLQTQDKHEPFLTPCPIKIQAHWRGAPEPPGGQQGTAVVRLIWVFGEAALQVLRLHTSIRRDATQEKKENKEPCTAWHMSVGWKG